MRAAVPVYVLGPAFPQEVCRRAVNRRALSYISSRGSRGNPDPTQRHSQYDGIWNNKGQDDMRCKRWRQPVRAFHTSPNHQASNNPYNVLGVSRDSSSSDIKKAYYALAKKYHPDTNKDASAKDRFAEAQAAYEILSTPEKKQAFDTYGSTNFDPSSGAGPGPGGPGAGNPFGAGSPFGGAGFEGFRSASGSGGFGANINFEDLFGAFTGGSRKGRGGQDPRYTQEEVMIGNNISVQTNISFIDAAKGIKRDVSFSPLTSCRTCGGNGMKKGKHHVTCKSCQGTGTKVHYMQAGFQMASTCDSCGGIGSMLPRGSECSTCHGQGANRERKTMKVDIPAGVEDGMTLRIAGEGDLPALDGAAGSKAQKIPGDLYLLVRVSPDTKFKRVGADVLYTASIPVTTALLGGEIAVPTLEGEVKLRVATGTATGDSTTMSGMGMPKLNSRRKVNGDLRVEYKVSMPRSLTINQRSLLEKLADELADSSAKRIMSNSSTSKDTTTKANTDPTKTGKPEGFLKSAWHKITHFSDANSPASSTKSSLSADEKD